MSVLSSRLPRDFPELGVGAPDPVLGSWEGGDAFTETASLLDRGESSAWSDFL